MNEPSALRARASRAAAALVGVLAAATAAAAAPSGYAPIPAGSFASVLPGLDVGAPVEVAAFALRTEPVTEAEFLAFVTAHPQWRRDRAPRLLAEPLYGLLISFPYEPRLIALAILSLVAAGIYGVVALGGLRSAGLWRLLR